MRGFGKKIVIIIVLIQLISLPIILIASRNQQETRSQAQVSEAVSLDNAGMAQAEADLPALDTSAVESSAIQSPQASSRANTQAVNNPKIKREVYGYLRDGSVSQADKYLQYPYLKTIVYVGFTLGRQGQLKKPSGWNGTKMKTIVAHAHSAGVKIHPRVGIFNLSDSRVDDLLNSTSARATAIRNIMAEIKASPDQIDGINIDFEPVHTAQRAHFTSFVTELRRQMKAYNPNLELTVATFASTAQAEGGFDLKALSKNVDAFFIMSFTLVNYGASAQAGSANPYQALSRVADAYLAKVPPDKIILGFPLYTGTWKTKDNKYRSQKISSQTGPGHAVFYEQAQREAKMYGLRYDDKQKTAWYTYYNCSTKDWRQVYFDNEQARTEKFEIANAKNLRGVGFWALNFDEGFLDDWKAIYNAFGDKSVLPVPTLKPGASEPGAAKAEGECNTPHVTPSPKASPTPSISISPEPSLSPIQTPIPTPVPTIIIEPDSTYIKLTIGLDGIGNTGTSLFPNTNSGNKNPLKRDAEVNIKIFSLDNELWQEITDKVYYQGSTGKYTNTFKLKDGFMEGSYSLYLVSPGYLRKSADIQIAKNSLNNISSLNLSAGDVDQNFKRNILDWNLINACSVYMKIRDTKLCADNSAYMISSDLDSNGVVDANDITLWVQEFSGGNLGDSPESN